MNTKLLLGILGAILLFVGVFTPIISFPIVGSMNYFQNGRGDGTVILALAAVSLILVLTKKFNGLWVTGFSSLAVMLFTFIRFQMKIAELKSNMETELAGNPFKGLAAMTLQTIQIQWGWALLIVGAGLVIASAAMKAEPAGAR